MGLLHEALVKFRTAKAQYEAELPKVDTSHIKYECAWCNKHIRGPEDSKNVSHGICGSCKTKFFPDSARKFNNS